MIRVRWFRNGHEHRNYWLRFGLMRKHRAGQIHYSEYPLASCVDAGFDPAVAAHEHRHTSVVLVEDGSSVRRCIVDSEDSFFYMSPLLLKHADLYFCAGYNRAFFEERTFTPPYAWQQPNEVAFYIQRARDLIRGSGALFARVRPFVPIGPDLHMNRSMTFVTRKLRNAHHKVVTRLRRSHSWRFEHSDFEARYRHLLSLRDAPCRSDIVLLDTLWGWPRHRYALHMRLRELAEAGREIHARLRWSEPMALDGGDRFPKTSEDFPLETGRVDNYEMMLASSRLAVFATGFHWGWRNIMTLALMWGLPIHADRLLLEPWFAMSQFEMSWNDQLDWPLVPGELAALSDDRIRRIKAHNQAAFDRLLAPEKVADYFVRAAVNGSPLLRMSS
jgi:hypothetical protein